MDNAIAAGIEKVSARELHVLQRIEEAVRQPARAFSDGKFTGINMYLAVDALLTLAGIEVVSKDPLVVASRSAEELK